MRGFCGLNRGQPQTRPPRRGCQSSRAALSTAAATGDTAAGNPQPPAGGCQSGIATATDSGPIPSATATDSRRAVSISTTAAGICPPPIPATDSGPIPSATATRAAGARGHRNRDSPPGKMPPGRADSLQDTATPPATGPPLRPQDQPESHRRAGQDAGQDRPRHRATPPGLSNPAGPGIAELQKLTTFALSNLYSPRP